MKTKTKTRTPSGNDPRRGRRAVRPSHAAPRGPPPPQRPRVRALRPSRPPSTGRVPRPLHARPGRGGRGRAPDDEAKDERRYPRSPRRRPGSTKSRAGWTPEIAGKLAAKTPLGRRIARLAMFVRLGQKIDKETGEQLRGAYAALLRAHPSEAQAEIRGFMRRLDSLKYAEERLSLYSVLTAVPDVKTAMEELSRGDITAMVPPAPPIPSSGTLTIEEQERRSAGRRPGSCRSWPTTTSPWRPRTTRTWRSKGRSPRSPPRRTRRFRRAWRRAS